MRVASVVDGWRPELHPRDSHGRFRNKWKLAGAALRLIDEIVSKFDPKMFASDHDARDYLRQQGGHDFGKMPHADLAHYTHGGGWQQINAEMRKGTGEMPPGLAGSFEPSKDDLILNRSLSPAAFGLTPEMVAQGGVKEWTGRLVSDKAPGNASIGTPLSQGPGTINMAILAPKGTPLAVAGGGSPWVVYEPGQPIRITKVTGNPETGIHVWAVLQPGTEKTRTRALGRKLTTAEQGAKDSIDIAPAEGVTQNAGVPARSVEDRLAALEQKAGVPAPAAVPNAPATPNTPPPPEHSIPVRGGGVVDTRTGELHKPTPEAAAPATPAAPAKKAVKRAPRVPKQPDSSDIPPEGEAPSHFMEKTVAGTSAVIGLRADALKLHPTPVDAQRLRSKLDAMPMPVIQDAAKSLNVPSGGSRKKEDLVDKLVHHVYGAKLGAQGHQVPSRGAPSEQPKIAPPPVFPAVKRIEALRTATSGKGTEEKPPPSPRGPVYEVAVPPAVKRIEALRAEKSVAPEVKATKALRAPAKKSVAPEVKATESLRVQQPAIETDARIGERAAREHVSPEDLTRARDILQGKSSVPFKAIVTKQDEFVAPWAIDPRNPDFAFLKKLHEDHPALYNQLAQERQINQAWTIYAKRRYPGKTLAEAKKEAASALRDATKDSPVIVRSGNEAGLRNILADGRLKTQFETGTSSGLHDTKARALLEEHTFDLPHDIPAEKRPVYGVVSPGGVKAATQGQAVSSYGDIQLVLKPSVRHRTTVTVGDSLMPERNGVRPAPIDSPDWRAAGPHGLKNLGDPRFEAKDYVEAQIKDGVKTSDIQEVVFARQPEQDTVAALEKAGLPWRVLTPGSKNKVKGAAAPEAKIAEAPHAAAAKTAVPEVKPRETLKPTELDATFRRVKEKLGDNPTPVQLRAGAKEHDRAAAYFREHGRVAGQNGRATPDARRAGQAKYDQIADRHLDAATELRARANKVEAVAKIGPATASDKAVAKQLRSGDQILVEKNEAGHWHVATKKTGATTLTVDRTETSGGPRGRLNVVGKDAAGNEITVKNLAAHQTFFKAAEKVAPKGTLENHKQALAKMTTREEATAYVANIKGTELDALAKHYNISPTMAPTVSERRRAIVDATGGGVRDLAAKEAMARSMGKGVAGGDVAAIARRDKIAEVPLEERLKQGESFKAAFKKASEQIGTPSQGPRRAEYNHAYFTAARGRFDEAGAGLREKIDVNKGLLADLKKSGNQPDEIAKLTDDIKAQEKLARFIDHHAKGAGAPNAPAAELKPAGSPRFLDLKDIPGTGRKQPPPQDKHINPATYFNQTIHPDYDHEQTLMDRARGVAEMAQKLQFTADNSPRGVAAIHDHLKPWDNAPYDPASVARWNAGVDFRAHKITNRAEFDAAVKKVTEAQGLKAHGKPGDVVTLDSRLHQHEPGMRPGDKVVVETPAYTREWGKTDRRTHEHANAVLAKGKVTTLAEAKTATPSEPPGGKPEVPSTVKAAFDKAGINVPAGRDGNTLRTAMENATTPDAMRIEAKRLRKAAEVEMQLAGMRQANNPKGSFHHTKGMEGQKHAGHLNNAADVLDRLAKENQTPPTAKAAKTAKVAAPPPPDARLGAVSMDALESEMAARRDGKPSQHAAAHDLVGVSDQQILDEMNRRGGSALAASKKAVPSSVVPEGHVLRPTAELPAEMRDAIKQMGDAKPAELRKAAAQMGIPVPGHLKTSDEIARHVVAHMARARLEAIAGGKDDSHGGIPQGKGRLTAIPAHFVSTIQNPEASVLDQKENHDLRWVDGKLPGGKSKKYWDEHVKALLSYQEEEGSSAPWEVRKPKLSAESQKTVKLMDEVLNTSPLSKDVTLYRGLQEPHLLFGDHLKGDLTGREFVDKGFMSTSTKRDVAARYAGDKGVVMSLSVPKGTKAVQLNDDDFDSEVLTDRGLTLKVTKDSGPNSHPRHLSVQVGPRASGGQEGGTAGIPGNLAKAAPELTHSEAAIRDARDQIIARTVKGLREAKTRDEARQLLTDKSVRDLRDIASTHGRGAPSGATKAAIIDHIVEGGVGNRINSEAIRGGVVTDAEHAARTSAKTPDGLNALRDDQLRSLATEYEIKGAASAQRAELIRKLRDKGAVSPDVARRSMDVPATGDHQDVSTMPEFQMPSSVDHKAVDALKQEFDTHTGEHLGRAHHEDRIDQALHNPGYSAETQKLHDLVQKIGEPNARRLAYEADAESALGHHVLLQRPHSPNEDPLADLPRITPAEMAKGKVDAARELKQHFAGKKVVVRTRTDGLAQILRDGRMKNALETGSSGGESKGSASYLEKRKKAEQVLFGLPVDASAEKRPIYGYLADGEIHPVGADETGPLKSYGDVQIVLKPDVRSRTTASVGDSIDDKVLPSPVDNPKWYSTNHIYGMYDEAHIHGGVKTSDIQEVVLPSPPSDALKRRLDEAGVPWRTRAEVKAGIPAGTVAKKSAADEEMARSHAVLQRLGRGPGANKPDGPAVRRSPPSFNMGQTVARDTGRTGGDEPLHLPNNGADQGLLHLDSQIGQLWEDLVSDKREPNSVVNKIAKVGEDVGRGKLSLDEAAAELRKVQEGATDKGVVARIQEAISGITEGSTPKLNLPDNVPPNVKKWLEQLAATPTMRKESIPGLIRGGSILNKALDLVKKISEDPRQFRASEAESKLREILPHESVDGAYPLMRARGPLLHPDMGTPEGKAFHAWLRGYGTGSQAERGKKLEQLLATHTPGTYRSSEASFKIQGHETVRPEIARLTTVDEVNSHLSQQLHQIDGSSVYVDFHGADVRVAHQLAEGILRGAEAFPGGDVAAQRISLGKLHPGVAGMTVLPPVGIRGRGTITYNRDTAASGDHFSPTWATPVHTMAHEYGHAVAEGLLAEHGSEIRTAIFAALHRAAKEEGISPNNQQALGEMAVRALGSYGGGTTTEELIADSIGRAIASPNPHALARYIYQAVREIWDRKHAKELVHA